MNLAMSSIEAGEGGLALRLGDARIGYRRRWSRPRASTAGPASP